MTVPGFEAKTASGPLEFRLQIVVEVRAPADDLPSPEATGPTADGNASRVPQLLEAARSLLQDLSRGLDVRMASFTSPAGVRLVAQGAAKPEDLAAMRAAVEALGQRPSEPAPERP